MKTILRCCLIVLALATTSMFAQAATAPAQTPSHHQTVKVAKKGHKKPKKPRRPRKHAI